MQRKSKRNQSRRYPQRMLTFFPLHQGYVGFHRLLFFLTFLIYVSLLVCCISLHVLFFYHNKTNYFITLSLSAVSWFISVDDVRSEARKENEPEQLPARPSAAWFEPCSRRQPWREPLRLRQVYEDRVQQPVFKRDAEMDPGSGTKTASSGLARVSLQVCLCPY